MTTADTMTPVLPATPETERGAAVRVQRLVRGHLSATLYLGDSLHILPQLAGSNFDGIATDPPYSSGGAFRGDRAGGASGKYVGFAGAGNVDMHDFTGDNRDQRSFAMWGTVWLSMALDACRQGALVFLFTDWRQLPITTDVLQAGGGVWRGVVTWNKLVGRPHRGRFRANSEFVAWGSYGPMEAEVEQCPSNVFECSPPGDREHITQKPVEVMQHLIQVTKPGGTILDPFMGSGTTGLAALLGGRNFVGIEKDPKHFATAVSRLEREMNQGVLL